MELYRLRYINPKLSEINIITVYSHSKMLLHEYLTEIIEEQEKNIFPKIEAWKIDKAYIKKNGICLHIWHTIEESEWLKKINEEQPKGME